MNPSRTPPQDKGAETGLLGSMICWPDETIAKVRTKISPEDFYWPGHRAVCAAIFELFDQRKPVDLVTLAGHMGAGLEQRGGANYLVEIAENVPGPASTMNYAETVKDRAKARCWIARTAEWQEAAYAPGESIKELLTRAQAETYELLRDDTDHRLHSLGDAVHAALDRAQRVYRGEEEPGLMTGFPALDRATGGFKKGDLITLAADTSAGKTTIACDILRHVAKQGGTGLFVTREMSYIDLGKRFAQADSGVAGSRITFAKNLTKADWAALQKSAGDLALLPVTIDDASGTVPEVAANGRLLAAAQGKPLSLVVVDYLQLMDYERGQYKRNESTARAVGRFAWAVKQMAMDLRTPVLLLSQLSRAGVQAGRAPTMHELKESGSIENHSNVVILLYRPKNAAPDETGAVQVWARIAKARDGRTTPWDKPGAIRLLWRPNVTRFEPMN